MMSLCSPENALKSQIANRDLPILYSFRRCPYAMRARLALYVSGVEYRLREVVLRDKPDEMLAVSPKGTVPVLQIDAGKVLEESREIMAWALAKHDPDSWLDVDRNEAEALINACDGPFKRALDRYKYPNRYGLEDGVTHREKGREFLVLLNERLANSEHLFGSAIRYPDAAIMPFIRQFANTDRAWFDIQPLPHLQRWLAHHLSSDRFAAIMTKFPQWRRGDVEPVFPGR
ncbi:MAG: glutathione S-transferase [Pseudomonadota bacterium]